MNQLHTSGLDCQHSLVEHAGVAHHVRGGKVAHDKGVLSGRNSLGHLHTNFMGVHFRLEIVGGDLGGGHHLSVLKVKLLFRATIEKEGHVGVLFGF